MVGGVFLAYQMMCNDCEYRDMEDPLEKLKHCDKCKKRIESNKDRILKYR